MINTFFFVILPTMKVKTIIILFGVLFFVSCNKTYDHKTVICIPVYGQSLALGEEAERITNFDSLANYADGRIITENLDHNFGYFEPNTLKKILKKLFHYQKRAFELTVYSMAETLVDSLGKDTMICIFPGGQGTTAIAHLGKGSKPYEKFLEDITTAYQSAKDRGWNFVMPALCWMQGETDVTDYPGTNYRQLLLQFVQDINNDVKHITGQKEDVEFICYQTNPVSRAKHFNPIAFNCPESEVPQTLLELVRDHPLFHASSPTYPYSFVREAIHIDAQGQIKHGEFGAQAALDIIRHQKHRRGLLPMSICCQDNEVYIHLNIPTPPLCIDTIQVAPLDNYGFSVITPDNRNIARTTIVKDNHVCILCSESPLNCRVRYAINGDHMKSGRLKGPRGNLRDDANNWCWQFDMPIE